MNTTAVTSVTRPGPPLLPPLGAVLEQLCAVSGAGSIDPDVPLLAIADVDSLDLMEWLYGFQESHPEVPVDESLFEDIDDTTTMRSIYAELTLFASPEPAASAE